MLRYANGPYEEDTRAAGSAFSKGDVLMLTGASLLSRSPALLAAGEVVGIALADSTESLNQLVPYLKLTQNTLLRASTLTNISMLSLGERRGLDYSSAFGFRVNASAATSEVVVARGYDTIRPSDASEVLVKIDPTYLKFQS